MQIFEDLFYFQRIDHLIRTRATGSPDDLARRIGLSRRHLLRLISALREQGFPIAFDKCRNTYYYTESVKIRFEVIVGDDELFRIQGGTDISRTARCEAAFVIPGAANQCPLQEAMHEVWQREVNFFEKKFQSALSWH